MSDSPPDPTWTPAAETARWAAKLADPGLRRAYEQFVLAMRIAASWERGIADEPPEVAAGTAADPVALLRAAAAVDPDYAQQARRMPAYLAERDRLRSRERLGDLEARLRRGELDQESFYGAQSALLLELDEAVDRVLAESTASE